MAASPPLPPDNGRLLSDWGMRRGRRSGEERMHAGMDLGHPDGKDTPVLNVEQGIVDKVFHDDSAPRGMRGYGNSVVVHHPDEDTWALYAHLDSIAVSEGQRVIPGDRLGTMGNSSNGKFPGMGVHLHLELRRRRPNNRAPFPGPYPRSPQQPFNSLDPRRWLESKGLQFARRGGFEIAPDSQMAQSSMAIGLLGVDAYPEQRIPPWGDRRRFPETSLAAAPDASNPVNQYEPPAQFDRDVRFGLTPIEWAAVGTGALVLTGAGVAVYIQSKGKTVRPNRRRKKRRRRRRTSRSSRRR